MPMDEPGAHDPVVVTVADRVATVAINRPDRRNAMDWSVFDGLRRAGQRVAADDEVAAVVVTGVGPTFSAGLDLALLGQVAQDVDAAFIADLQAAFTVFEDCPKPTVAVIRGHCLGAGVQLAAACHLRLVVPDATIAVAERRWGLVPDLGGTWRLPRLVGLGVATDWIATGRDVGPAEAAATGFARAVDDDDQVTEVVAALAAAPGATRRAIRLVRDNLAAPRDDALAAEARAQLACLAGPDVAEAVAAARQRRRPRFVGD